MRRLVHIVMLAIAAFTFAGATQRTDDPIPPCSDCGPGSR